ncbi:MAG: MBL fold metallo-hydrolase [Deltaproteobacteria bacterium]|nr:MAG: MBL fold metallo-hydrolase [Deltaproteobacteria bacterium]
MIVHNAQKREPNGDQARFLVRYWGVRGSIATPGRDTVRYGGNTTCVEIVCDDARLIIDMGTGARLLGDALVRSGVARDHVATVLFSHFHSDHVIGFPFFAPLYDPQTRLTVYANADDHVASLEGLHAVTSFPLFPVEYDNLPAQIDIRAVEAGVPFQVGDATVKSCRIQHPGGALAFRIEHRGRAFVHASDLEHDDATDAELLALCQGADWVSYDAMFVEGHDYEPHRGWGHSTWQAALRLADAAQVGRVVLTHHAPNHDDRFMDGVARDVARARPGSLVAAEGLEIDLLAGTAVAPPGTYATDESK